MAGIGMKMITGDHELTALSIVQKIGVAEDNPIKDGSAVLNV
jgi:magnesium-transporting ATPase (P-type)